MVSESIRKAHVYPNLDSTLQVETMLAEFYPFCRAIGTTRVATLTALSRKYTLDMHYNLYKESVPNFEDQRQNLLNLMAVCGARDFVSTALFHGTSDVVYANKNGLRILGPGSGKRAYKMPNYDRFDRAMQLPADGIICEPDSGIVPVTYSADCVTGVFAAPNGAYGVFHSMSKKLNDASNNIILSMVSYFYRLWTIQPEDLKLALFPSACPKVYEVDEDFAAQFDKRFVLREYGKKPRLDLEAMAIDLAQKYGVNDISISEHSTAWGGLESLRGTEHSLMANGAVGNSNGQNIVFVVPYVKPVK